MTGRYKAYSDYKESNYEWLGNVPSHWGVAYSKWLFSERNNKAKQSDEMLTASQKYGVIPQKIFMQIEQQKVVQVQKGHDILKQVKRNDFVISMRSFQGGIEFCEYDGSVSSAYVPLEPKEELSLSYFKYLFKSKPYIQALQATTNLVRDGQALRYNNFLQVKIPVPEQNEAEKIGTFLDYETAKIDTLITKQEKLIKLLKEKRQAVISQTVTKGLNPDAPMKDSGVEWLGEVPEHWDRSRLGFECSVKARLGWKGLKADEYVPEGYIFLATPNIKGSEIDFENVNYITKQRYDESPEIMLQEKDLLVTKDGSTTGTTNLVRKLPAPATVNSSIAVIRSRGNILPEYLYYFFVSTYTQNVIKRMQGGMGVPHLFQADLRWFHILLPSSIEQESIAKYLDTQTAKCDLLIEKATNAIQLMKERKTALISAAVTGKIDVRDWQPKGVQG
ncbi:TPA: restriction endonuclease subunit S [Vibrio parahaemolyticus]|nr:restriction endonuclease subunit S [Vibrio parahaemolyticus]